MERWVPTFHVANSRYASAAMDLEFGQCFVRRIDAFGSGSTEKRAP
jgi:hypothetical protein